MWGGGGSRPGPGARAPWPYMYVCKGCLDNSVSSFQTTRARAVIRTYLLSPLSLSLLCAGAVNNRYCALVDLKERVVFCCAALQGPLKILNPAALVIWPCWHYAHPSNWDATAKRYLQHYASQKKDVVELLHQNGCVELQNTRLVINRKNRW